ncbi:hypothetical protein DRN73_06725 [Candidatus Pacearchaeota archaeon]|nr:MAG: hypothetical protein DRN73_06725 [Candidatus Pacearchaeota archaeon]
MNFKIIFKNSFVLVIFFLFSCFSKEISVVIKSSNNNFCEGTVFTFINNTKEFGIEFLIKDTLTVELSKNGYILKDSSIVKSFFTPEERIRYFENPEIALSPELTQRLGNILGLKWIIGGKILEAEKIGDYVRIEVLVWVKETKEGKLIWYSYYKRDSDSYRTILHFGRTSDLYTLVDKMVKKDIIKDLKKVLICERK